MENFLFAFRYLKKLRGNNVIRVLSLSLGLAVGLLLFSYSHYQLTADRCFRDGERIWQVWISSDMFGLSRSINAPFAPAFAQDVPQVESATRLMNAGSDDVVRGDNSFSMHYFYADTLFFETLGFEVLQGDPKQILQHEDQVMLSESAVKAIFGGKDPVGQQILLKGTEPFTVMGVFCDPPENQHLGKFEMLLPFEKVKRFLNTSWYGGDSFWTYIKLREGTTIAEFEAQIPAFSERHQLREKLADWGQHLLFYPIADASRVGASTVLVAWILMALAALTLFIAVMNYVLISVSTLVSRSKTIAMLKVGGARRSDIFSIFCWETALLILMAVIVAVFLIWGLQAQIYQITQTPVGDLFSLNSIWLPLCVILAAFALAALIPAQLFTAVPVTLAFRGIAANRRRWKHALLFVEVASVTLVTVLLLVFYLQFDRLRNGDFGFEHDRLVYTLLDTPINRLDAVCSEMTAMPEVEAAGITMNIPLWGFSGMPCYDENTREVLFSCRWLICNDGFIPTLEMEMAAGRNFTPVSASAEAIVNETYVRMRGWNSDEAIGRQIADDSSPEAQLFTVVGVVRDFRTSAINGEVEPLVMHPYTLLHSYGYAPERNFPSFLVVRLREVTPEVLTAVQQKIEQYPSDDNHRLDVYDNKLASALSDIRSYRNIVLVVCCIILLIALTGLVGYLGDEIRRRGKEIAIRKVNGASAGKVIRLLARDILWLCIPAMAAGVALSWWCAGKVLSMFVEKISLSWWIFAVCAFVVVVVIACVQLFCTWRIANSNPIDRIKTE